MGRDHQMPKKGIFVVYGLAMGLLILLNVYMYSVADAGLLAVYGDCKLFTFAIIIATTIFGVRRSKLLVILTVLALIADPALSRVVTKGSLDKFLFGKNERLYHQAVSDIVDKGLDGHIYLEGTERKLYIGYVYVKRFGDDIAVCFSMGRPGARNQIVYTDNKKALQDFLKKARPRFEALDKQWWLLRYDH